MEILALQLEFPCRYRTSQLLSNLPFISFSSAMHSGNVLYFEIRLPEAYSIFSRVSSFRSLPCSRSFKSCKFSWHSLRLAKPSFQWYNFHQLHGHFVNFYHFSFHKPNTLNKIYINKEAGKRTNGKKIIFSLSISVFSLILEMYVICKKNQRHNRKRSLLASSCE